MADTDINSPPSLTRLLFGMPSQQKLGFIVAMASTVALLAGLFMWGQTPDYRVLYANMDERDGGAVIEALQQQNVPYKFSDSGTLMVPADRVHEMRLQMAARGLPKGGAAGFELMENQKFGTSQFLEQVNYQRALEGELARSMETLGPVAGARVHLAIPKPSVFAREQQKPSASVVLSLHAGRALDAGQVSSIVHLISSSIPNMPSQAVTVVDQSGTLLSSARDSRAEQLMDATQLKYVRQIEMDYVKRIEDILIPITGPQNVRAQVTASVDFIQTEQTSELYKPNQPPNQAAIRSSQSLETQNGTTSTGGVPGALTNQPPVPATAPLTTPAATAAAATAATPTNAHKEQTTNFEVDRTIQHTRLPTGSIQRLSIAVVVNNPSSADKDGKVTSRPYTEAEKAQITALVRDAVGFDAKRGDSLNLLNSAFNNVQEVVPETPIWKQPDTIAMAKDIFKFLLIAGGVFFLLFGVIKPAYKTIAEQSAAQEEAWAAMRQNPVMHHAGGGAGQFYQQAASSYEDNLQAAKQLAKEDPKIVASVVKEWVNKE